MVNADQLEPLVWSEVKKALLNPNLITAELERVTAEDRLTSIEEDIERAKERLDSLKREERRIIKLYRHGEFDLELLKKEMKEIVKERAAWEAEKANLEERLENQIILAGRREAIETYCWWASQNIESFGFEEKRKAIEALRVEVTASKDRRITIRGVIPAMVTESEFGHRPHLHHRWPPR
jgi:regulator of replication initiation timing